MAETVYNLTISNTSPTLAYTPYVTNNASSSGWQSSCPTYVTSPSGQNSWICDLDSAHITSSYKAGFQLSFEGVGIHLFGNTTNSLGYDITLDGIHFPGNPRPDQNVLYSSFDLKPGSHSISLTVRQPASASDPGSLSFTGAVVSAGTGRTSATVMTNVLDDGDRSISYYTPPDGNWTIENVYTQAITTSGSTTFHDSYWTNATATIAFQGDGIAVYGACYSHSRYAAYAASIDGAAETSYDGTVNLYSEGGFVKQRAGNCLRYFKTDLDGSQNHQLVLRVKDAGRLAIDWVEVFTVSGGVASDNPQGRDGNTEIPQNKIPILAGAIAGGVVLALALITIFVCFRCRNRPGAQDNLVPPPPNPPPMGFVSTPFDAQHIPTTSTSPQPPTPAPSGISANGIYASMPVSGRKTSFASSGGPLISPGLTSTSSYTSGPVSGRYRSSSFGSVDPSSFRPNMYIPSDSGVSAAGVGNTAVECGSGPSASGAQDGGYHHYVPRGAWMGTSPTSPAPPTYEQVPGVYLGHPRKGR